MMTNQTPAGKAGGTSGAPASPLKKTALPKKSAPSPQMNAAKPKKPMPRFMVAVWCFVAFLLLLAGAGYCVYANVGGIAGQAMVLLPQYKASMDALDKQQKDLNAREAKLAGDSELLSSSVKANDKKAAALQTREDKLKADRQALDDRAKSAQTAEEKKKAVADIYAGMDAATASAMLLKAPTLQEAADILTLLPLESAIEIIAAIEKTDAKKAYDLTKLMLK